MELKTLKDLKYPIRWMNGKPTGFCVTVEGDRGIREEAIKIFKNLQGPDTIYPIILNKFPEGNKGEIAKDNWHKTMFRYGTEYGMLAMLYWLMNLTEEDLK